MLLNEVVMALHGVIESHREDYNEMLQPYGLEMGTIFDFESMSIPISEIPAITLGNPSFRKQWVGSEYLLEDVYEIPITGFVNWEDSQENAELSRKFLDLTSQIFEMAIHEETQLENFTYRIHHHSEMPIMEGNLDYTFIGDALTRSWSLTWRGYLTRQAFIDTSLSHLTS
jgi:hypothetical protein